MISNVCSWYLVFHKSVEFLLSPATENFPESPISNRKLSTTLPHYYYTIYMSIYSAYNP